MCLGWGFQEETGMLLNVTRNTVLCRKIEVTSSLLGRVRGLMFRSPPRGGFLMDFGGEAAAGIWTFGMLYPIDILWIDSGWKVVGMKENANPFRYLGYPVKPARFVLETRSGVVRKARTRAGDELRLIRDPGQLDKEEGLCSERRRKIPATRAGTS